MFSTVEYAQSVVEDPNQPHSMHLDLGAGQGRCCGKKTEFTVVNAAEQDSDSGRDAYW